MWDVLLEYRHIALTIGLLLGGTPGLIAAIFFALNGYVSLLTVMLVSLATTAVWDTIWYSIGRFVSSSRLMHYRFISLKMAAASALWLKYERHQVKLLFLSRFLYGTNSVLAIVYGLHRYMFLRYLMVSMSSIIVWFLALTAIGVTVDFNLDEFTGAVRGASITVSSTVAVVIVVYALLRWFSRRVA